MKSDFLIAITQVAAEKNLPREVILEAVEAALVSAYRKDAPGGGNNISVRVIPNTGDVKVYATKTVVEVPQDPYMEISLQEARKINANVSLGESIQLEITSQATGRIAAQTAKQVVIQRLREAERDSVYEEFSTKQDDIISGIIQRIEARNVILDLGRVEAILPLTEQVPTESYRVGQRLKAYMVEVSKSTKGPQILVSRTHRNLLRRLLELEVPEVHKGLVEIKSIAREPGQRSKVAVAARQKGIDPVGACVGLRGIRIQNIVNELKGERIDVVQWHEDPTVYIANSLNPAQTSHVLINNDDKAAIAIVPDRQLSLAIGKEGQNVRLAVKLTGWRIDIKSASTAEAQRAQLVSEQLAQAAPVVTPAQPEVVPEAQAVPQGIEAAPSLAISEESPAATQGAVTEEAEEEGVPAIEPEKIFASLDQFRGGVASETKPAIRFAEDIMGPARGGERAKPDKKAKRPASRKDSDEKAPARGKRTKSLDPLLGNGDDLEE